MELRDGVNSFLLNQPYTVVSDMPASCASLYNDQFLSLHNCKILSWIFNAEYPLRILPYYFTPRPAAIYNGYFLLKYYDYSLYLLFFFWRLCYNFTYKVYFLAIEEKKVGCLCFFWTQMFPVFPIWEHYNGLYIGIDWKKDVTQFYSGYRGEFDRLCARLVSEIKQIYPPIVNTMVLSYHPREDFILPSCFDDCVYLLDKIVPPRFAISYTNKKMVEISDYIISGVKHETGGAAFACAYAKRKKKIVISLF